MESKRIVTVEDLIEFLRQFPTTMEVWFRNTYVDVGGTPIPINEIHNILYETDLDNSLPDNVLLIEGNKMTDNFHFTISTEKAIELHDAIDILLYAPSAYSAEDSEVVDLLMEALAAHRRGERDD